MRLTGEDLAASLASLLGRPLDPAEPLAVAVSGGPDSLGLLLLAQAACSRGVRALTVDHGWRPESAAEAAAVARLCAARGIEHATLRWTGATPAASRQAAARAARYRLLGDWCRASGVRHLATAHHADDQAETLLMRLARGAGVGGLSAIRPVRRLQGGIILLRPLLGRRKTELAAIVAAAGLTAADDPSNVDPRYDRTRARALLAREAWLDPVRLAAAAGHLGDAEAALAWTAEVTWAGRAAIDPRPESFVRRDDAGEPEQIAVDTAGLPAELVHRLVARAVSTLTLAAPRGAAIGRLVDRLSAGHAATLAGVSARPGAVWTFRRAPPRRRAELPAIAHAANMPILS